MTPPPLLSLVLCVQVGELYIHYHLKLPDGEDVYEQENVICLLKDKKELYIQKDYLKSKLDICRYCCSPPVVVLGQMLGYLKPLFSQSWP